MEKQSQITDLHDIKYEINDLMLYEKYQKVMPHDIVLDIGAHVGMFTMKAERVAGKVFAVEPDPMFFKKLVSFTNTFKRVKCIQAALGPRDGFTNIISNGSANHINSKRLGERVTMMTLKSILNHFKIIKLDFMKIDCEGNEYDILTNMDDLLWIKDHCKHVAGEFHIHNNEHRINIIRSLNFIKSIGLTYKLTDVQGNELTRETLYNRLHYYTEIHFYISKSFNGKNN